MPEPIIFQRFPMVQKAAAGSYWWCACGRSATQPFCDGSHQGTGLSPTKVDLTESKIAAWCACKHSKNPPFCDGSHGELP
jgi:CDGSH iron-sulfur domain-containing protein 3